MPVGRFMTSRRVIGLRGRNSWAVLALASVVLSLPALSGCSPSIQTHGHSLEEEQIAKIRTGATSRQNVLQLMGSPSALSTFDDDAWYYISQRTEKRSFYQEGVIDQEVVTITFDDQDKVVSIDRHGLDQMASINPVDRITPTVGSSPSIMEQLIGNIGRFSSSTDPDS